MRFIMGGLFVAVLLGSLTIASSAGEKTEAGYVSLFNGKDLTGWKYYKETDLTGKTETADKRFRVENGVIVAEVGKGIKDLYTVKAFNGEFNLKMEFRASLSGECDLWIVSGNAEAEFKVTLAWGKE